MHNQFKSQKFKHLMLAMGPRDLNFAPYSPVHCSSHSMTSFQSSELTELPVVENSQLFAQRVHSACTAHGTPPQTSILVEEWPHASNTAYPTLTTPSPDPHHILTSKVQRRLSADKDPKTHNHMCELMPFQGAVGIHRSGIMRHEPLQLRQFFLRPLFLVFLPTFGPKLLS